MNRTPTDELINALELALRYLEHPDVAAMPFALGSLTAAKRVRRAIAIASEGFAPTESIGDR